MKNIVDVVYVVDRETPKKIKIFDPNNLGASCGSSGFTVLPGWVLRNVHEITSTLSLVFLSQIE